MDLGLERKTVLVTASTAGIGYATALGFAKEGARVIVNGRTEERVAAAVAELQREAPRPDRISGVAADVGTAGGTAKLVAAEPSVDVLVNNAGIFEPKAFEDILDEDWLRFYEVNVLSGVRLARAYLPGMLERNWGRILFVSSESGLQIPVEMIHYGMTKTAQLAISRGLAERTRGTGVTVNAILPGPTRSEGVGGFLRALSEQQGVPQAEVEKQFFATARPSSLIQRFAGIDEIANLIVYAGSARASATTGSALRVDGGVVRHIG